MCEWQDISTAPKDGTTVLLFMPDESAVVSAQWDDESSGPFHWQIAMSEDRWNTGCFTHWMPLPDPPDTDQPDFIGGEF